MQGPCEIAAHTMDRGCITQVYGMMNLPVTWHQARPNREQDLEIYQIAVVLWNKKQGSS